jgi:DNA polymerase-3 subunit chi
LKSTANFYSLNRNHNLDLCICSFVKYLYKEENKIILISSDHKIEKIDKLLWTFEQNSFLPHKVYKDGDKIDTPILLSTLNDMKNIEIFNDYKSIINNQPDALLKIDGDINIYEFVEDDETNKSISRNKYSDYKKYNFTLLHKAYDEQAI